MVGRDVRAGRAFIEFFLKDDRLDRDLRMMRRKVRRIAGGVTKVAAAFTAVGAAAGVTAAAGILKAVNAASDFQETVGKFNVVFGPLSEDMRKWSDELAKNLGVARKEVMDMLSGFQDLFVPLGIDPDQAAEMSQQLAQLALDLSSFNNMNVADVVRDLQAAMTGSSETMKKYGVIVDAAAVKQELLNQGLDAKTATNAEKAFARLNLIMGSTNAAQGDLLRTQDSFANRARTLQSNFQEMWVEIGQKFLPIAEQLLEIANIGMQQLIERIPQAMSELETLPDEIVDLAKQGKWDEVGEAIGKALVKGIDGVLKEFFGTTLEEMLLNWAVGITDGQLDVMGMARMEKLDAEAVRERRREESQRELEKIRKVQEEQLRTLNEINNKPGGVFE